jgi:hypothetical protein
MTNGTDYTSYEWALLITTPEFIGLRMLSVSRSGPIGKLRELATLSACLTLQGVPMRFRRNELLLGLLEDISVQDVGVSPRLSWSDVSSLAMAIATAKTRTLLCCEEVATLLADKTPWAEADGLKRWLLWLATRVAQASGDNWLGLGRRVSDAEATMLHQIATALGFSKFAPVPFVGVLDVIQGVDGGAGGADNHSQQWASEG